MVCSASGNRGRSCSVHPAPAAAGDPGLHRGDLPDLLAGLRSSRRPDRCAVRRQARPTRRSSRRSGRTTTSTSRSSSSTALPRAALPGRLRHTFSRQPVNELIARAFPMTIRLAVDGAVIEPIFGISRRPHRRSAQGGIFDALVAGRQPRAHLASRSSCSAFTAQCLFGIKLGWFRTHGRPERSICKTCCFRRSCWRPSTSPTSCA